MRMLLLLLSLLFLAARPTCELASIEVKEGVREREEKVFGVLKPEDFRLSLDNVNGSVTLVAEARADVAVSLEKIAPPEHLQDIRIDYNHDPQRGLAIRVTHKRPRYRGPMRSNFTFHLPRILKEVKIRTMNGSIEAQVEGEEVGLETVNGHLEGRVEASQIRAHSKNGGIELELWGLQAGGEIETLNGSLSITLLEIKDLEVEARTMNGRVKIEGFDRVEGDKKEKRGVLGQGGPILKAETINGSITIESKRES